MVLMCKNGALDFDTINDLKPDGIDIYCRFDAASHKPSSVPEKDLGTFVVASDGGVVYLADVAFKMLTDMAARVELETVKYIKKEFGRAGRRDANNAYMLSRPKTKRPLGSMLAQHGIRNALMPDDSKIVAHNLKAFVEYDIISGLCLRPRTYGKAYRNACLDMAVFITDRIYIGKGRKSFMDIHKAWTDYMCSLDLDEIYDLVNDFYDILLKIPDTATIRSMSREELEREGIVASGKEIIRLSTGKLDDGDPDDKARRDDDEAKDGNGGEAEKTEQPGAGIGEARQLDEIDKAAVDLALARKPRMISGADITGFDDSYSIRYREDFYMNELVNADSEGFLEQIIAARANGGAAPLDLLSEAISREHSVDKEADILRRGMGDIRSDIMDALGGAELKLEPKPGFELPPEQESERSSGDTTEPEQESEQGSGNIMEPESEPDDGEIDLTGGDPEESEDPEDFDNEPGYDYDDVPDEDDGEPDGGEGM